MPPGTSRRGLPACPQHPTLSTKRLAPGGARAPHTAPGRHPFGHAGSAGRTPGQNGEVGGSASQRGEPRFSSPESRSCQPRCPHPPPHQAPGVQPRCPPLLVPTEPRGPSTPGSGCRRRCRHQRRALRREEAEPQTQTTAPARAKCAKKCVFWGRGGGEALLTPAMFIFRAPNLPCSHGENAAGHRAARHAAAPRQLRGLGVKSSQKRAADAGPAAAGELEEAQGLPPLRLQPVPRRSTRNS